MNFNVKWNPFGNYDEPMPPIDKWQDKPRWVRQVLWFIRNPFHNLFAYVLGFRDKDWKLDIWKGRDGLNVVLPFMSYRKGRFEAYIGWRPDSRMLGIALRWHKREVI